jgi:hypothetical protein
MAVVMTSCLHLEWKALNKRDNGDLQSVSKDMKDENAEEDTVQLS